MTATEAGHEDEVWFGNPERDHTDEPQRNAEGHAAADNSPPLASRANLDEHRAAVNSKLHNRRLLLQFG